jgi:hypothetical protein
MRGDFDEDELDDEPMSLPNADCIIHLPRQECQIGHAHVIDACGAFQPKDLHADTCHFGRDAECDCPNVAEALERLGNIINDAPYRLEERDGAWQGFLQNKQDIVEAVSLIQARAERAERQLQLHSANVSEPALRALALFGWQPIETAPKDGTQILLWITGIEPRPRISFWSERGSESGWYSVQSHHFIATIVTHWMPLPEAPTP